MRTLIVLFVLGLSLQAFTRVTNPSLIEENVINAKNDIIDKNVKTNNGSVGVTVDNSVETPLKKMDFYKDEVLLNHIRFYDGYSFNADSSDSKNNTSSNNYSSKSKSSKSLTDEFGFSAYYAVDKNNSNDIDPSNNSDANNNLDGAIKKTRYKGKCIFHADFLVVEKKRTKIACTSVEHGVITLILDLIPNVSDYTLLSEAKIIITADNRYLSVDSEYSIITDINGIDGNIASEVNTRGIDEFKVIATKEYANVLANASLEHMESIKNSETTESSTTDQNGNIVVIKNQKEPDLLNTIGGALITGTFKTIAGIADSMRTKLPYLYKINEGTLISVDLAISEGI